MRREISFRRSILQSQRRCKSLRSGPRIMDFLSTEDWNGLRFHLSTKDGVSEAAKCVRPVDINGQLLLHVICQRKPPVDVVQKIVNSYPNSVKMVNFSGRTPLHLAVASGASPKVVRMLVNRYPEASAICDEDGKTPLHLACEGPSGDSQTNKENAEKWRMVEVVRALCSAWPDSVNKQDSGEMSPLRCAIFNGADEEVIHILQSTSASVMPTPPGKVGQERTKICYENTLARRKSESAVLQRVTVDDDVKELQYVPFFRSAEMYRSERRQKEMRKELPLATKYVSDDNSMNSVNAHCVTKKNVRARSA